MNMILATTDLHFTFLTVKVLTEQLQYALLLLYSANSENTEIKNECHIQLRIWVYKWATVENIL